MKYYFIIDPEKAHFINWSNFILPDDMRLLLITDSEVYEYLIQSQPINDLNKSFKHIEVFDFNKNVVKPSSELTQYMGSCFESLKSTIIQLKNKYVGKQDEFYIITITEAASLDCCRLREFFQIPGSQVNDVIRFFNKDCMKQHLVNHGIQKTWIPKYLRFIPDQFLQNQKEYVNHIIEYLKLPVFIKPLSGTGSLGICKIEEQNQLIDWCHQHVQTTIAYEMEEYIEGDLYHCASIIQNNQITLVYVSKYLNPCGEAFLNQKLLGSIIIDQQDTIALKIQEFNNKIINAMMPIENCVMHHEIFHRKNGELVFLEITNRVIEGGRVAEMFYDQFGLNFREIDYKLRLGLDVEITPKIPDVYYALIASIAKKGFKIKKTFPLNIKSQYKIVNRTTPDDEYFDAPWEFDISCHTLEIQISNTDYQTLLQDFNSLKDFRLCEYEILTQELQNAV